MNTSQKVLIIEDSRSMREFLTSVLQKAGFQVILTDNGNSGIAALGTVQVDLVITDIVMPGKNGLSTILDIRRKNPQQKIIAISGSDRKEEFLNTAIEFGANQFICKPFTADELLNAISTVMRNEY